MSKARVTKIVVEIDGKELKLSPDDARRLRDELNRVLGGAPLVLPVREPQRKPWHRDLWYAQNVPPQTSLTHINMPSSRVAGSAS